MILDKQMEMVTTVAMDLGNPGLRTSGGVAPHGPGRPIHLSIMGITADTVTITTGDTSAAADALLTVTCPDDIATEVLLPSTCKRWIKATFANGSIDVILDNAQTNR